MKSARWTSIYPSRISRMEKHRYSKLSKFCYYPSMTWPKEVGCQHIRSLDIYTCTVPQSQSQLSDRSFTVAGPWLRNDLPTNIRQKKITSEYHKQLPKALLYIHWASTQCNLLLNCAAYKRHYSLTELTHYELTFHRPSLI